MTDTRSFAIRKAFLIPLGLLLLLSVSLFAVCLVQGEPTGKVVILGVIILPVAVLFVESAFRRAEVSDRGVTVFKFLRQGALSFDAMTSVDTVQVRKRAFLTLSAGEDFLILSNAYADFPGLVNALLARVPQETVSEETQKMAAAPPVKSTDIVSCWLAVALMGLILYIQLGGKI
ncbi:MAG: hypothetical protein C0617_12945 [Desulfuromonas sp.]|uniref:hypothetical protein n=1 Tax=Desulfuromonas sp. TaxID=892 RepID=UPI000CB5B9F8|nr:hypothetical protein [Desulfuromonas sp.]PLX82994.1 MAG: hypothetical protein C0617_12945 [Desulfuromonas sp.]